MEEEISYDKQVSFIRLYISAPGGYRQNSTLYVPNEDLIVLSKYIVTDQYERVDRLGQMRRSSYY